MKERGRQLAEQIRREVSALLVTELHDPRISRVTVTGVMMTRDLGLARIYWTTTAPTPERTTIARGLAASVGFIRRALAKTIRLRLVPKIEFFYDESFEEMERIETLFTTFEKR